MTDEPTGWGLVLHFRAEDLGNGWLQVVIAPSLPPSVTRQERDAR